jgi:dipeptidase
MVRDVEHVWKEIETKAFTDQTEFETKMLAMYKKDPLQVKRLLTEYSQKIANDAVARYWQLQEELWTKYTYKF